MTTCRSRRSRRPRSQCPRWAFDACPDSPPRYLDEVPLDRVGHDIFVDFGGDDVLVGLVDLDDLFDAPVDVIGEKGGDLRHGAWPQKIFGR